MRRKDGGRDRRWMILCVVCQSSRGCEKCWKSKWSVFLFFFFNDTATTEIYTLSLHDALPICDKSEQSRRTQVNDEIVSNDTVIQKACTLPVKIRRSEEHTSELQSHVRISYAVFCLKKKTSWISIVKTWLLNKKWNMKPVWYFSIIATNRVTK